MTLRRAFPLVLALAALTVQPAVGQIGGMPAAPPQACQQLLTTRDEVQKHGMALRAAGQRKAGPEETCTLFKAFLASETKMIEDLEQHKSSCGVPDEVIKQLRASHMQVEKTAKQVCDAAPIRDWIPIIPDWGPHWKPIPDWGPRPPSPGRLRLAGQ